jgi:two-component system sensor histidine kinase RegB
MGLLTVQLYLSGGASNPFIALYLLQVVLGAILLRRSTIWVLVVATSLSYALLTFRHIPLVFPTWLETESAEFYQLGNWVAFVLVATLLVLFMARIARNLRSRNAHLADLRQRAAEEDGIIQMGLFASGAAHELGTPLASISVILSDWRRMPKLADDPELLGELTVMQAEVQRCKVIVSDILHSAGQPRGEEMESMSVPAFLDDLVEAWRPTHPAVLLYYHRDRIDGAVVVADPALRQAIWNILDNAAEHSPVRIELIAANTAENDALVIAVRDAGSGFAPEQLETVGKPCRSNKGAGHGLGLFLAANVARRLDGRLEAANRVEGGAEVRMILPLTPSTSLG